MKRVKEWKEPWKKKEPNARLSNRALKDERIGKKQRSRMERLATLRVRITCHKSLFLMPGLFRSFNVQVSIPMRESEFMERMKAAFPELKWEEF